jgi:hypothetical protein
VILQAFDALKDPEADAPKKYPKSCALQGMEA